MFRKLLGIIGGFLSWVIIFPSAFVLMHYSVTLYMLLTNKVAPGNRMFMDMIAPTTTQCITYIAVSFSITMGLFLLLKLPAYIMGKQTHNQSKQRTAAPPAV